MWPLRGCWKAVWLPLLVMASGCGLEPALHPVSGKVTVGGKTYSRVIIYFRPLEEKITKFNLGVGETDSTGNFMLGSNAGPGIAAGKYRVSFSCFQTATGQTIDLEGAKPDERAGPAVREIVPAPYDAEFNLESSPLIFEVKRGENVFDFDVPLN
jgi:hypothetical protein